MLGSSFLSIFNFVFASQDGLDFYLSSQTNPNAEIPE